MKKTKRVALLILVAMTTLTFNGCKKATLKKIEGTWTLESLSCAVTNKTVNVDGSATSSFETKEVVNVGGGKSVSTETNTNLFGSTSTVTIQEDLADVTYTLEIKDDGTFTMTYSEAPTQSKFTDPSGITTTDIIVAESSTNTISGSWWWGGSEKENDRITFEYDIAFMGGNAVSTYDIDDVSKDELVLTLNASSKSVETDGDETTTSTENQAYKLTFSK